MFQDTNVTLSMLSTNPLLHTSFFRDVLAHCRYFQTFLYSQILTFSLCLVLLVCFVRLSVLVFIWDHLLHISQNFLDHCP